MDQNTKPRERPGMRARLAEWLSRWGVDLMLTLGAILISVGVGWICPPAGLIAAGGQMVAGGVLLARGGGIP